VTAQEVEWLWYPYIPRGKLTLLEGNPGVGKSYLALQFCAIVSRGRPWPKVRLLRAFGLP
jgi:predicted ATP-dependent serine protease